MESLNYDKLSLYTSALSDRYKIIKAQNNDLMGLIKNIIEWDYQAIIGASEFEEDADQLICALKKIEQFYRENA